MRSVLTALGVIIGILAVTLMGTAINGIDKGFDNSLSMIGYDVLYVQKWPWSNVDDWWNYRNRRRIKTEYADQLNKMIEASQDETEKIQLTNAAEAIMKICGNKSIIINQMNTDNFLNIWNVLTPLMNNTVKSDEILKNKLKQDLLNLVSLKENIGEGLWYIYTAILISSIVYYNLATRGCVKSVDQIKNEHDTYIKEQEEINKQNELNNTTYVI
jgi:ABC-type antimicrobial peptide transport system permease subunit